MFAFGIAGCGARFDPGGKCERTVHVLSSVDAPSLTGRTAADVLSLAEGVYAGSVTWIDNQIAHEDAGASVPVEIEVAYAGGEIRDVDATLVEPCLNDAPCECDDTLEIDVALRIVADDGSLDEHWVVTLEITDDPLGSETLPGIRHTFDPDEEPGGLQTDDLKLAAGENLRAVSFSAGFTEGAIAAGLHVEADVKHGVGFFLVAEIGAAREVTGPACIELVGPACAAAGCAPAPGRRINGGIGCECAPVTDFCFAEAPASGETTELWARPFLDGYEVVVFEGLAEPLPAPWVSCNDPTTTAIECECFGGAPTCP